MSSPTVHSNLGASSAYRWMACPGSVKLSENIPRKDTSYSLEGTAAHALGEIAYAANLDPSNWLGENIDGVLVTQGMVDAVRVYVEFLKGLKTDGYEILIEHRFDLSKLNPPSAMFGTSDCVGYHSGERRLVVGDYKHGAGVAVEVEDNSQLKYYGLGALLQLSPSQRVDEVELVIVQPRAQHKDGPIRRWTCTVDHLLDFSSELIEGAQRTMRPDAPLAAGKHCRFCPAQPMCPELHKETQLVAADEFADKPLLDPRLLTPVQLGEVLERADLIEDWLRSVRQHVQSSLESGNEVPGWKLVPKRASRVWQSEQAVVMWAAQHALEEDELYERKLKTPAALEKVVGKKNLPADLYASVSSGYTLAPASDPRPAVTNVAADEFSALPPGVIDV